MNDLLKRLHEEDEALFSKILALDKAFNSEGFEEKVGTHQFNLLSAQFHCMLAYRRILSMRIDDLESRA